MRILILSLLVLSILILFNRCLRGTVYELSIQKRLLSGFFIWKEIFLLIIFGSMVFEIFGPNEIAGYITKESIENTTPFIFLSIILLILSISFFSKTIFRKKLILNKEIIHQTSNNSNINFLISSILILLLIIIIILHSAGLKHAFQNALFNSESLLATRLGNRYESSAPLLLFTYNRQLHFFLAILLGFYAREINKKLLISGILISIYASTINGDKSPLIYSLTAAYIAYTQNSPTQDKLKIRNIILSSSGIIALIIYMIKLQYPEIDIIGFMQYAADRLAVGQIQGVYEQFALRLRDFDYLSAEIPFSGRWLEHKSFGKDLMMNTLSYGLDPSSTGVLNSFFIGNALAAGGTPLAVVSPIFVAFNFCLMTATTVYFLNSIFRINLYDAKIISAYFIAVSISFTGDLSGLLFGKAFIYLIFLLFLIYTIKNILKLKIFKRQQLIIFRK